MRRVAGVVLLLAALVPAGARAVQIDALDTGHDWRLRALRFRGERAVPAGELRQAMVTRPRPWYAVWRPLPDFDPIAFRTDLDRLRRACQSRGYYAARIEYDLELPPAGDALVVVLYVDEGAPVTVDRVDVTLEGAELPAEERRLLLDGLPIGRGLVFTEDAYTRAWTSLRAYYREHGFARAEVSKQATVDLGRAVVEVAYRVDSGPPSVFGDVRIEGTSRVDPAVVRRELAFTPGAPFRQSLLDRTRRNLVALNLFRTVGIDEEPGRDPRVDLRVRVTEAPRREIRLGVGYDTDEDIRGLASWRDYDFLGGARQLGFSARASFIQRAITADFLQPHFPGAAGRTRLLFSEQQDEEAAYTLDRSRLSPRLDWQPVERLVAFGYYRAEYDSLSSVNAAVTRCRAGATPDNAKNLCLPGAAPGNSILSGFGVGVDWNGLDDLLDPTRGWTATTTVEPVGGVLGGDLHFLRLVAEGRAYHPLVGRLLGAARVRLGTAEPFGSTREVPLFERFYAGGQDSVRGYGRRRVGPFIDGDPVGGRSLAETSLELRHPITETIAGAVFLDGGQVSIRSYDFPFGHFRYGTGFGVRYHSPVGPIRVYLGFPVEPPDHDQRWQVHVSIGAAF